MKCAGCGFDAQSDFAFCPKCGTRLPPACPSCGAVSSPDFAFCPRCGTRLGAPVEPPPRAEAGAIHADRRLVSVLFADLSGFTALSERVDPEDVRAFQNELFQTLAAAVQQYDGFVEKFVGDAVMAVFGAPVAHEDDPERALRAALAMHERMEALSARWEACFGAPLTLHVGVNTGPVVAGHLGSAASAAYAVTGDTVNTAARLQGAARPGRTLVSESTYRLTQHAFVFEPLGSLTLKGKTEPIAVYEVRAVLGTRGSARGLAALGLGAPLVGRGDELARVRAAFDRTAGGQAQVVSVIGEAGAGKSRLLREVLEALEGEGRLAGVTVRWAACSALGEQTYGVLATLFREAYGVAPDDSLDVVQRKLAAGLRALGAAEEETARVVPVLVHVLGMAPADSLRHVEPEQLRRQIFLAARTVLERRLQHGPLVLVVEDAHWADRASVDMLEYMVDRLADRPLMLLVTHRPLLEGSLVSNRVPHTVIRLTPLSATDSEALLDAFFGPSSARLPATLREVIVERAGGNPLFLEEMVRALVADGVLARGSDGWACTGDVARVEVPATLQGLLLSRVDRLPPDARLLLQECAVLGLTFEPSLLRMICSEPDRCEANLEVLRRAELLGEARPAPGAVGMEGEYRFTQALVQEVVYQNLLLRRRTELHERTGLVLEKLAGAAPARLEEIERLGHHFSLSGDRLKGARYLLAAGDRARAIYANDDALRSYERALKTLEEAASPETERTVVQERLADLLGLMGRREAALARYAVVREASEAAGDRPGVARVHRKMGGLYWDAGERERALRCYEAGLTLLDGHGEHIELAHLYQERGRLAFRSGDNEAAVEWAQRALAHAERLAAGASAAAGEPEQAREAAAVISHAYNTLGVARARLRRLEEAVADIERSVAVAEAHGLAQAACRGYTNLGVLYSTLDPGRAIETCLKGLETAKKTGDLGFQSRLYANLAVAYCALTDRCDEEGVGAAETAIELDRQLGQLDHLAIPLIVLGQIHQCHGGDPELALRCYREALALAEQAGEPQLLFPCYDGLGTLYLELGDEERAEEFMLKAQQVCERAGLDPDSLVVLPFLG